VLIRILVTSNTNSAAGDAPQNAMGFQAPQTSGIQFNDLFTVFLNGEGGIESVINGTGAVSPSNGGPSDVVGAS
jgi:hypothetical protein